MGRGQSSARDARRCSLLVLVLMLVLGCLVEDFASADACFCRRREPCWPSDEEIALLHLQLNPAANRTIIWDGDTDNPKPAPLASYPDGPTPQVFFGAGAQGLEPVYQQPLTESIETCFEDGLHSQFCNVTVRNNPQNGWSPAFVVFPTTTEQVQTAVKFAAAHNLELCIAATGHDFLNRHSCNQGMMIRTTFLKSAEWSLEPGNPWSATGTVKFGTGLTWEEVSHSATQHNRIVASGWCGTVGLAGWTLGGGYGPFTRALGLGADQLLGAEVVLADGSLALTSALGTTTKHVDGTTTSSPSTDLYWALRGGGGSTFGIVTSMTVKAHPLPDGGVSATVITFDGDMCAGRAGLEATINDVLVWIAGLSVKWSGLTGAGPSFSFDPACNTTFHAQLQYAYYGPMTDPEYQSQIAKVQAIGGVVTAQRTATDQYSFIGLASGLNPGFTYITTKSFLGPSVFPSFTGALPSVLVSKKVALSGRLAAAIHSVNSACQQTAYCASMSLSHGMPPPSSADKRTAVSPGMRDTLIHFWSTQPGFTSDMMPMVYSLGDYSYFSESTIQMDEWPFRYWGRKNYKKLLKIKRAVDPKGVFTCYHCIGDKYQGADADGLKHFNM